MCEGQWAASWVTWSHRHIYLYGGKCAELHIVEVLSEIDTFDEFAKFGQIFENKLYENEKNWPTGAHILAHPPKSTTCLLSAQFSF